MIKANIITETTHYIECPYCHKSKERIDHLFEENTNRKETSFGPWYCDECGGSYEGVVRGQDVFIKLNTNKRKDDSLVFLRNGNVLLIVKGMYFDGDLDKGHQEYFYNEHTCPTNYFKSVEMVVDLKTGDTDPHGIFEYVDAIPYINLKEMNETEVHKLLLSVLT
jgi:ribosomal protein L37AE/L43A